MAEHTFNCSTCGDGSVADEELCPRCSGDETIAMPSDVSSLGSGPHVTISSSAGYSSSQGGSSNGGLGGDSVSGPLTLPSDERYEVLGTLGRGGMGVVYKVHDLELDEVVALKVLRSEYGGGNAAAARFKREIKIARRINHRAVARLYDLMTWRGSLAISQELIGGEDLEQVIRKQGPLAIDRILRYLEPICSALQLAHGLGVVHRDLKSSNIRIDDDDLPRVLDFGLAAMVSNLGTESRAQVLGTPHTMAPEQANSPDQVDHRADLYSLGIVLFQMATGKLPFTGSTTEVLIAQMKQRPPRPRSLRPDLPVVLEDVILRCLEKDPAKRYSSAADVFAHARKAAPSLSTATPSVRSDDTKRGKILVIDASGPERKQLVEELVAANTQVIEANDGYHGIEMAMAEKPDLILLSRRLPVLDGLETLRILKSSARTAGLGVVFLTGEDDEEEAVYAREIGADALLEKPLKKQTLELVLDRFLRA